MHLALRVAKALDQAAMPPKDAKYRVLGITDSEHMCHNCGKQGLKRVVALGPLDGDGNWTGDVFYVGTDCASRLMSRDRSTRDAKRINGEAEANRKALQHKLKYSVPAFDRTAAALETATAAAGPAATGEDVLAHLYRATPEEFENVMKQRQFLATLNRRARVEDVLPFLRERSAGIRREAKAIGLKVPA